MCVLGVWGRRGIQVKEVGAVTFSTPKRVTVYKNGYSYKTTPDSYPGTLPPFREGS